MTNQHIISSAMQQFTTEAVLNYDRAVRSARFGMPRLRWDTINHDLWSMKLMQFPRPSCSRCGVLHSRDRCLVNPDSRESRPFHAGAGPSNGARRVCFNYRGLCTSTSCFRIHQCTTCGDRGHRAVSCPRVKWSKSADITKPAQASASHK